MWPWGHLGVGYLCYVFWVHGSDSREQTFLTLLAMGFGTQFPDIIDKPLAWSFELLPSGRSLAHSLLTASLILAVVYWIGHRRHRTDLVTAFGIGYLSHSFADLGPTVVFGLLYGDMSQVQWTTYLLWPVLPSPPYPSDSAFMDHLMAFRFEPYVIVQFLIFGVGIFVWIATGTPGLNSVRDRITR
ncbi:metal-dependent hydrolase [Halorussus gelatinilyticus]|uniref:Metal-dependent hydrolase n=1 Tax=Halorussus gelatinilyticus TaxID=2937524 RepID=A0A8U0IDF9_9EURY|nr:metal-dependent hydrolase [Halorussus gelatinilyticus]UPV98937.1 metal-dependent hydrolase [Halorussus gelatinilyticus]